MEINVVNEGGKGAGLQFHLEGTKLFFYFFARLEYDGFKVGLSSENFNHANSNAISTEAELKVGGMIKVVARFERNLGTINVLQEDPNHSF